MWTVAYLLWSYRKTKSLRLLFDDITNNCFKTTQELVLNHFEFEFIILGREEWLANQT